MKIKKQEHNCSTSLKEIVTSFHKKKTPIITMHQAHSNNIHIITTRPKSQMYHKVPQTDGLITTLPNVILSVKFADCLPIIIYHPYPILCVLHAGRKGTEKKITEKALEKLILMTQAKKNYKIIFGPHICTNCYQICKNTNTHYNLSQKNMEQINKKLHKKNYSITIHSECTCCGKSYYSYRGNNHTKKRNRYFVYFQPHS